MKRIATTVLVAGLMAAPMLALPPPAQAAISVGISVNIAPPPLPVYEQPVVPGPGYIWTPGFWAWDPGFGYYWVPGTWVMPPQIGLLWTPGWWGWSDGYYRWHPGYWGRHVGFYGGINYGHGYFGAGYVGGEWRGRDFYYNRAVNNVSVTNIHNVYVNRTVVRNVHVDRVSYNGGRGGITAHPTAAQRSAASARRWSPTSMQERQREVAKGDPGQRFKVNQGRPAVFATQHVGKFEGPHAVRAPSAPRGHATGASTRASRAAPQPHPANTPDRGHTMVQAPRERTHPAPNNAPNRGHATLQAPRERTRPVQQPMQPQPSFRSAPVQGTARPSPSHPPTLQHAPRNPPPHNGQSSRGQPPASSSHGNDRGGKPQNHKHKHDGGHRN